MISTALITALCLATAASATTHDINVGKGGLTFDPASTTAAKGDTLVFHFFPGPHGVAQADFSAPCQPLSKGFYSGFIATSSGEAKDTFTVTVNSTDPIYIYCPQIGHCQAGMVAAINAPSSGNTLTAFSDASAKTSSSGTPPAVAGGIVGSGTAASGSSSASSAAPAASTSAASGGGGGNGYGGGSSTPSGASSSNGGYSIVASAIGATLAITGFWLGLV